MHRFSCLDWPSKFSYELDFTQIRLNSSCSRLVSPEDLRVLGKCPLTPEEAALVLAGLGFKSRTYIFLAGSHIYGGNARMHSLTRLYPNLVTKETLLTPTELSPFKNFSSKVKQKSYLTNRSKWERLELIIVFVLSDGSFGFYCLCNCGCVCNDGLWESVIVPRIRISNLLRGRPCPHFASQQEEVSRHFVGKQYHFVGTFWVPSQKDDWRRTQSSSQKIWSEYL